MAKKQGTRTRSILAMVNAGIPLRTARKTQKNYSAKTLKDFFGWK